MPDDLIGSEIIGFGAFSFDVEIEGDKFAIVYKTNTGKVVNLILGFSEGGIWIHKILDESLGLAS